MAMPRIGDGGKPILGAGGKPLACEEGDSCCGVVIANCTEWDSICSTDPDVELSVETPGTWFEAGTSSCDCTLIPAAGIITTTCESLFNVMRGETSPKIAICSHAPTMLEGFIWAIVSCESGNVEITIRQLSTKNYNAALGTVDPNGVSDLWVGFHEWTTTFAPPLTTGSIISVPWNRRVETMTPSGLFTPIGCRPTNSTMADATIVITLL